MSHLTLMERVGILFHPRKAESQALADEIEAWLAMRGVEACVGPGRDGSPAEMEALEYMPTFSLLIVLGGDGSTLRAARLAAPHGVPIFGINMGRVGFLSEAQPDQWRERLDKVLRGDYWLERHLMIRAHARRDGEVLARFTALNDVVVGRRTEARVLRLHLYVDGDHVTTYTADGLIVATPTGSTAYAMAAGGPLLPPQLPNFLVVPVAPHLSLDRGVVLHEDAVVTVEVGAEREATVTADGQDALPLISGDQVVIAKHENETFFARVGSSSYFYHRLMERLGFWHPKGRD